MSESWYITNSVFLHSITDCFIWLGFDCTSSSTWAMIESITSRYLYTFSCHSNSMAKSDSISLISSLMFIRGLCCL